MSDRETLERMLRDESPSFEEAYGAAIRAVLAEGERLREEVQSDIEHAAEWHLKWDKAEARIDAALAKCDRDYWMHYANGPEELAREVAKALKA